MRDNTVPARVRQYTCTYSSVNIHVPTRVRQYTCTCSSASIYMYLLECVNILLECVNIHVPARVRQYTCTCSSVNILLECFNIYTHYMKITSSVSEIYGAGGTFLLSVIKSIEHNYVNLKSPIYHSASSHVIRFLSLYLHEKQDSMYFLIYSGINAILKLSRLASGLASLSKKLNKNRCNRLKCHRIS